MILKPALAAFAMILFASDPVPAQQDGMDDLLAALKNAPADSAEPIAVKIIEEWSKSGSPAMDMLLARGRKAMKDGDAEAAVGHLSALIDHAPDFAEAYSARATAFFAQGRFGESLDDIRTALALNPGHFNALAGLGIVLEEMGYRTEALAAWRAVQAIYPANPAAGTAIARLQVIAEGVTL